MSLSSPFELFLFIKKINMNELIQSIKSFNLIFINIDDFENKLISHTL